MIEFRNFIEALLALEARGDDAGFTFVHNDGSERVIGAELREASSGHMAEEFNSIASAGTIIELPTGFSEQDAGDAAQHVLQALRVGGGT